MLPQLLFHATLLLTVSHTTAEVLYVSSYDGKVTTLNLTSTTGSNSPQRIENIATSKGCGANPSWLLLDHPGTTLYCVDEGFDTGGSLSSLRTNDNGSLTALNKVTTKVSPVSAVLFGKHGLAMAH